MLPDIGEGIAEVEVLQWFVKPGDSVEQFDKLCEVQSDKATVEITSPSQGVISSLEYQVGSIAKTGTALLFFAGEASGDASIAATSSSAPVSAATPAPAAQASVAKDKVLSTPATRALAKRLGIDLSTIVGTGKGGRVTKEDVHASIAGGTLAAAAPAAAPTPAPAAAAMPTRTPTPTPASPAVARVVPQAEDKLVPIRGIRKAMFAQMTDALKVPHFNYCDEVVMDEVVAVREKLKPLAAELGLPKFTLMPLIVKATSLALTHYPELNASITPDGSQLQVKAHHNIGVAMDTPHGLLVPNIKNVGAMNLLQIGEELARLQKAASAGKLSMEDLKGGTFTLSNIGNLGGTYTGPVINLPEVAIAGLGKARPTPRYDSNGALVRKMVMQVSWAADHRVVDGAMMARFSNAWIGYLEQPSKMLLLTA